MEPVGNAMTANHGDETDDGVCKHIDYENVLVRSKYLPIGNEYAEIGIQCISCGAIGLVCVLITDTEILWGE